MPRPDSTIWYTDSDGDGLDDVSAIEAVRTFPGPSVWVATATTPLPPTTRERRKTIVRTRMTTTVTAMPVARTMTGMATLPVKSATMVIQM